jgi:putative transcriptional regulator
MLNMNDPQNLQIKISTRIREVRLEMGLTQEQFAAKLGVSFPTVNRWENQKAKPSPLALQKLQKILLSQKRKTSGSQKKCLENEHIDALKKMK